MRHKNVEGLYRELAETVDKSQLTFDAPMSRFTTLRLGGPADLLLDVHAIGDMSKALSLASEWEVPVTVIGNGSNLLVRDGGIRGLVLRVAEGFSGTSITPLPTGSGLLTALAGTPLTKAAMDAADAGYGGLAFAAGIPGTVGGAVYMNAGAYGGEMKDVVTHVHAFDKDGNEQTHHASYLAFGYRTSAYATGDLEEVITQVMMMLPPGDPEALRKEMCENIARRRQKQPLQLPSCGSTFKRPEGHFAGALIEQCGLKGVRIGGASVSTLHAGFLVNDQNGTAADYIALIRHVQKTVLDQTGVSLTPEVRILGED